MPAADATGLMGLPAWAGAVLVAFVVVVSVLVFLRRGLGDRRDVLLSIAVLLVAASMGWVAVDLLAGRDPAGQRRSLDMRVLELTAQAMMPGSALACLDAIAGETVETSCEKAVFASPEATAAAVSYVAAQLSLLAAGSDHSGREDQGSEPMLASLRRALEADRFGIVAHVLAVRDGCTRDQCKAFELLGDPNRVSANLAEATYDGYVKRHMAAWSSAPGQPVAAADAPPAVPLAGAAPAPVAGAKPPSNLFFPSAASIPPVNIMTAEPGGPPQPQDATGSTEAKPAPARKPRQARRPASPAAPSAAPLQLGPGAQ